jgi:hypothetical protein
MSMTFARLLDPCFEDDDDPFRYYDYRGEPLEDRLSPLWHRPPQEGLPRGLSSKDLLDISIKCSVLLLSQDLLETEQLLLLGRELLVAEDAPVTQLGQLFQLL